MVDFKPELVLAKTSVGLREIAERHFGLDLRLRRVLILVDGKASISELLRRAAGIPDFVETLKALIERGFVAPADGGSSDSGQETVPMGSVEDSAVAEGSAVQKQIADVARQLLGDHAERVVTRLASGGSNTIDLGMSVDACYKLIKLTIDEKKAEDFLQRARRILAAA
jgi:hypothetical protein